MLVEGGRKEANLSRALDRICGPLFGKNLIVVARRPPDQSR